MCKSNYDLIFNKAFKIIDRAAIGENYFQEKLENYLSLHGWTHCEFEKELLKNIDKNWEPILN